jgi:hypothetical protein
MELLDDKQSRIGYWLVMGSWFGRVVGRRKDDVLSNIVCKSLSHVLGTYDEALEVDPEIAVHGYEASIGRVDGPGVFRVLHDLDPCWEGSLLLDDSKRQLRRAADDACVLVESWSGMRWRLRDASQSLAAFGSLKRLIS